MKIDLPMICNPFGPQTNAQIQIEDNEIHYDYFNGMGDGFTMKFDTHQQAKWIAERLYHSLTNPEGFKRAEELCKK